MNKDTSIVQCTACTTNYYLQTGGNECLLLCTNAGSNCAFCTGTFAAPTCTACKAGFNLIGRNRCVATSTCDAGTAYYLTLANAKQCLACPKDCLKCFIDVASTLLNE